MITQLRKFWSATTKDLVKLKQEQESWEGTFIVNEQNNNLENVHNTNPILDDFLRDTQESKCLEKESLIETDQTQLFHSWLVSLFSNI